MTLDVSFYDNFYQTEVDAPVSNGSIVQFLKNEHGKAQIISRLPFGSSVLELGSGPKSIWCNLLDSPFEFFACDFSKVAIDQAIATDRIKYEVKDVREGLCGEFDLIIDSHLLHTLTNREERLKLLKDVAKVLKPNGRFLTELMMKRKGMNFFEPFEFDLHTDTLYRSNEPWRTILSSLDWEKELQESGLQIVYLRAHSELHFEIDPRLPDPFKNPELLRVILEKV